MANIAVFLFSLVLLCITAAQGRKTLYPNNELPASSPVTNDGICKTMVDTQGYTCEEHKVTTDDGYILSLQRMPVGRSGKTADKQHCEYSTKYNLWGVWFQDAISWLFNSPNESLAFILADNGFDVWLANTRGTKYSQGHKSLSPNDMAYWEWSWDELASYDLSASVQYVYNHTGQKLHYVGHSLGTLMALAALSQGQLLNMLRSAALLCPIAHMDQIPSQPSKLAADIFLADDIYWLGLHEFIPNEDAASKFLEGICNTLNLNCSNLMTIFTGPNCCINSSRIDVLLDHEPQPTSTKNLIHLAQMIRTGKIAKYDYGDPGQNMLHYGKPVPPPYDMTTIPNQFPLFLSYGGKDTLSDVKDVKVLLNDLKDHDRDKLVVVFKEDYAHADFVMGVNAKQVVYDPMIAFLGAN
ncbi:triacylglycerol lipase 2-like [Gastrolobium bilobum]|uniref:triacylglycerol lipase 2-like n=1 Tax=Gastrolobium bilobum TaxID=150636 RepID=UPI002AB0A3FB|nr:triacylglycerol lipase 2-like [Gastrolobium bilobum]